jgi:hypothetical protein
VLVYELRDGFALVLVLVSLPPVSASKTTMGFQTGRFLCSLPMGPWTTMSNSPTSLIWGFYFWF